MDSSPMVTPQIQPLLLDHQRMGSTPAKKGFLRIRSSSLNNLENVSGQGGRGGPDDSGQVRWLRLREKNGPRSHSPIPLVIRKPNSARPMGIEPISLRDETSETHVLNAINISSALNDSTRAEGDDMPRSISFRGKSSTRKDLSIGRRKKKSSGTEFQKNSPYAPPTMTPHSYEEAPWLEHLHVLASTAAFDPNAPNTRPPKPEPFWTDNHRKDRPRLQPKAKKKKGPSLSRVDELKSSWDDRFLLSSAKPKLKKYSSAPPSAAIQMLRPSHVVDDALMHRAALIRDNLRHFEMLELAAEAERAAESGLEKFVGSASKFGEEESPPSTPLKTKDEEDMALPSQISSVLSLTPSGIGDIRLSLPHGYSSLVACNFPLDISPSYMSRKKIRVTALRNFSEVVPNFSEIHSNIRVHLGRQGVDRKTLPFHPPYNENSGWFCGRTPDEGLVDDDDLSQDSSLNASQAGSLSSLGSYAVASLKGLVDYVARPKNFNENESRTSALRQAFFKNHSPNFSKSFRLRREMFDDQGRSWPREPKPLLVQTAPNSDSDDSSVELYGWRTSTDSTSRKRDLDTGAACLSLKTESGEDDILVVGKHRACGRSFSEVILSQNQPVLRTSGLVDGSIRRDEHRALSMSGINVIPPNSPYTSHPRQTTPVAKFLSKIQDKLCQKVPVTDMVPKITDEENKIFIVNYFYTHQKTDDIVGSKAVSNLKLDINPEHRRDAFCMSGCGHSELLPSCGYVGNIVGMVFSWLSERRMRQKDPSDSSFTTSSSIVLHHDWIKTWQVNLGGSQRQLFLPPQLSARRGDIIYQYSDTVHLVESGLEGDELNEVVNHRH